jgi:hypothetical protein
VKLLKGFKIQIWKLKTKMKKKTENKRKRGRELTWAAELISAHQ